MGPWIYLIFLSLAYETRLSYVNGLPEEIRVVGLFDTNEEELEWSYRFAINRINTDDTLLSRSKLYAIRERIKPHDSFHASKTVCHWLNEGVITVIGPTLPSSAALVESTCETMNVPHLETNWNYRPHPDNMTINLYPDAAVLSQAFLDLVESRGWKSVAIIYETNQDLIRIQGVFKAPTLTGIKISLHQLLPKLPYKKLMKTIHSTGVANVILSIDAEHVVPLLREAKEVNMLTDYTNYVVASLDFHTLNLEEFQHMATNVTGLRLVDPERPEVQSAVRDWNLGTQSFGHKDPQKQHMKTETALLYDALSLLARALNDLDRSQTINVRRLNCSLQQPWEYGMAVVNYMKMINIRGLTGTVLSDERGRRVNFELDIVDLKSTGIKKVGTWNPMDKVRYTQTYETVFEEAVKSLENRTLRVTTIATKPYTIVKEDHMNRTGNDRFEGYNIDLIDHISKLLHFKYEFNLVKDGSYGSRNLIGEWNGMIKELIQREADIAIGDLTITSDREEAVDFTMPFMTLGISILFKKQPKEAPGLFSFLTPLKVEVWVYMVTAYLGVSLLLFLVARFTPYEWVNPHPCEEEASELENQFNLLNCLWFTIGSLMQQGSDLAPRAFSTRCLGISWWFFTLIMISTYTANLAAFQTASRMSNPIESAQDLAVQTKISYGCVLTGSTKVFFEKNKHEPYKRMWAFMESAQPTVFVENNDKGIERVLKGNYAFLMESTTIEYRTERNCELVQIGGLLDRKGYGIATPQGSPYRPLLTSAILRLQETDVLHNLKQKWWKSPHPCPKDTGGELGELGLDAVGGVFLVLGLGMGVAVCTVVAEFFWKTKKVPRELRDSLCVEFLKEVKMLWTSRGSERPVPKSESASVNESLKLMPLKNIQLNATSNNTINRT